MNKTQRIASLALFVLALPLVVSAQNSPADYAVIVNRNNPAQSISAAQLRRFVLGEDRFWPGRLPVSLILQDERSLERQFVLKNVVHMSPSDYHQHWSTLLFRGAATTEPMEVPSNGLASGLVASQAGALCIIRTDSLPKNDSVKVLRVDGKLPGEAGYPLR
jgi:hypothetical protein